MAKKKNKIIKSIVISMLVPIIIVIMICSLLFAIIDGIIGIITGIISGFLDFISNPWEWLIEVKGGLSNWVASIADLDFDPDAYTKYQKDPTIKITEEEFSQMKKQLTSAVDRNTAGLDDIMLKKMLLTYYRGIYLTDTTILLKVSESEKKIFDEADNSDAFKIEKKKKDDVNEEEDGYYLETKGIVEIKTEKDDNLIYYPKDILEKIYNEDYVNKVENNKDNFANSVKEYLERAYTTSTDGAGIQMYEFVTEESEKNYTYEKDNIKSSEKANLTGSATLTTVDYSSIVTPYITPVEFLVNLMEISQSQEFINKFMDLIYEDNYVKLKIYKNIKTNEKKITNEYSQTATVIGKKPNVEYIAEREDGTTDGLNITKEMVSGNSEKINIKVVDTKNIIGKIYLYQQTEPREQTEQTEPVIEDPTDIVIDDDVVIFSEANFNKDNNWTKTWDNLDQPTQENKELKNTGKVTVISTNKTISSKYDIGLIEAKTWYAKMKQENNNITVSQYSTKDKENQEILIDDVSKTNKITQRDSEQNYLKSNNADIINTDNYKKETDTGEKGFLHSIFNNTIRKETNYKKYEFNKMNIKKESVTEINLITNEDKTVSMGVTVVEENADLFLGLLSNKNGKYEKGAKFVSKKANPPGIVVKYETLNDKKGKTGVGELLINGAEMLFELLDSSYTEKQISNTRGLSDVMRWILYLYSGNDYGVTSFNFSAMSDLNFSNCSTSVIGNSTEEKIWFTLKAAGYSDFAVAGVMGNIEGESSYDPKCVESNRRRNWIMSMVIWKKRTIN